MAVRRWAGRLLGGLVLVPLLVLGPAAVIDRGPDGAGRGTILHAALAVWDPYVWLGLRNSLLVASGVTLGALVLGTALAFAVARRRFWGRGPLTALAWAPMAVPPLFGAIGLRCLSGRSAVAEGWQGWLALVWVELACAVPWVARRAAGALRRVDPIWEDAARVAGAGRWRSFRDLAWPIVRPEAARAAATVFAMTLFEPGAPLALGLRRTLAYQAVESATRPGDGPRAASLALMALVVAAGGRFLIRLWGRNPAPLRSGTLPTRSLTVSAPQAAGLVLALGLYATLALAPALGLVAASTRFHLDSEDRPHASLTPLLNVLDDPELRLFAVNALFYGGAAGGIALSLALVLRRPILDGIPPLAIGIGAMMVPGLLDAEADWQRAAHGPGTASRLLHRGAEALDPYKTPGLLLVYAIALSHLPTLGRIGEGGRSRRPDLIHAARSLGASRRRARREPAGPQLRGFLGPFWLLATALAVADAAASLVLAPTSQGMNLSAGSLLLLDDPGGLPRAGTLAACAVALNLAAFALAIRHVDHRDRDE